jgi:hypothetical protein
MAGASQEGYMVTQEARVTQASGSLSQPHLRGVTHLMSPALITSESSALGDLTTLH